MLLQSKDLNIVSSEFKKQTDIAKKRSKGLGKF